MMMMIDDSWNGMSWLISHFGINPHLRLISIFRILGYQFCGGQDIHITKTGSQTGNKQQKSLAAEPAEAGFWAGPTKKAIDSSPHPHFVCWPRPFLP
jgi:hypothetical protein